jgi:death-on-curing protein
MIAQFGGIFFMGNDNLLNAASLNYLFDTLDGSLLDFDPYPTIVEKAALVAWRIISGHIFIDGNKRTGMECCRLLLELNGYDMLIDQDVVITALRIAQNEIKFPDFVEWLKNRISIQD